MNSSASCASWKWDFHFSQCRPSRGNPSNLGCLSGKIYSARRERDATAKSHASEIARPALVALLRAYSQRVMNYWTRRSSTHQYNIPCWRHIMSIASPPVLVAPRWYRRSRRVTCLNILTSFFRRTTQFFSTRERTNFSPMRSAVQISAWQSILRGHVFSWRRRTASLLSS